MKFPKILLLASGIFLTLGLFSNAIADYGSCGPCYNPCTTCYNPCPPCGSPCVNWFGNNCGCWYGGGSVLYATTSKFDGWGLSGHVGYIFCKSDCGQHAVEFEVDYIHESASRTNSGLAAGVGVIPSGFIRVGDETRSGKLDMVPLMLNYVYHANLGSWVAMLDCMTISLGGGVGVNILRKETHAYASAYDDFGNLILSGNQKHTKTSGEFAGQVFTRLGYNVTDCIQAYVGARAFFTEDVTLGSGSITELSSGTTHLLVDIGANYRF